MARKLHSLELKDIRHLSKHLRTNPWELRALCAKPELYCWQRHRNIKGKMRLIATPMGRLREILDALKNLLHRLQLPDHLHGGICGRSNRTNAAPHVGKAMVLTLDIKDFFPSVWSSKVYRLFNNTYGCAPDVSRILTRLTTLNGCLPQGYPTSVVIANCVLQPLVTRLEKLASGWNASYTQYVDDITFSGGKHIARLDRMITKVVRQGGFDVKPKKTSKAGLDEEQVVTGVRVNHKLDSPSEKIQDVRCAIEDIAAQVKKGQTPPERDIRRVEGKINYIRSLNRGAGKFLHRTLKKAVHPKAFARLTDVQAAG